MEFSSFLTLIITIAAAGLLISEVLRPDLIALLILISLGITGLVSPQDLFGGFSGSAVITILSIYVISEGLHQTGITQWVGHQLFRIGGTSENRVLLVTMLFSALLSLFMNNIAAVGVLLPTVISLTRRSRIPASRLLMPLAFGTILGGMATLLTTSNIIVSDALRQSGYKPFGLLDFLPIGAFIVAVGTIYMVVIGKRMLPSRQLSVEQARLHRNGLELTSLYNLDENLCEVEVLPGSPMADKSIYEGNWGQQLDISVIGLKQGGKVRMAPRRTEVIRGRDVVIAQGNPDPEWLGKYGLRLLNRAGITYPTTDFETTLAEIVITPHASILGKSLRDFHFREKYNLNVLAIWREGQPIVNGLADIKLRFGDALLVQGRAARILLLQSESDFFILEEDPEAVLKPRKAHLAGIIGVTTLVVAALGVLPIPLVTLTGAVVMLLTGCLTMDEAYRTINWRAIFFIAGIWPLSIAIQSSGLAEVLVHNILAVTGGAGVLVTAALVLAVTAALTNLLAGQAAAPVVMAPIGLALATTVGADPRAMSMLIALGCSIAFPTPIGHPVNIMVMSSGGYSFRDYLRVGIPLSLLVFLTILAGIHFIWGL